MCAGISPHFPSCLDCSDAGDILRMLEKDVPKLEVSKERVKHINKVIVT